MNIGTAEDLLLADWLRHAGTAVVGWVVEVVQIAQVVPLVVLDCNV